MYKKLFIPGPTHVRDEILETMATPMIGHRSKDYVALQAEVLPKLQTLLYTENRVFLSTSSSTGLMEGAVRNCVAKRCLNTVCGAFSKRWHEITLANGKAADKLEVDMGQAITPEMVDEALSTGAYDAITVVHNETSTGVMNPLPEIAEVLQQYPDVCFLVDAVSSMAGAKIEVDTLGIDVCLAGVQKCFALPAGLAVASVSQKALDRAAEVPQRGYYFDFLVLQKYLDGRGQTPATPAISQIFALNRQVDDILAEGLEARWQRHEDMAAFVRNWARQHFALYSDERYLSPTVTNVHNTRGISVADLNAELGRRGAMISNGYGSLKETCFRIAHMGDLTLADLEWLTGEIDDILEL
jgi:predicted phosphoserine aminotransferase